VISYPQKWGIRMWKIEGNGLKVGQNPFEKEKRGELFNF
jgi:hypothetical protein